MLKKNNQTFNEPKIFENIFDSLFWLTNYKDNILLNQYKLNSTLVNPNEELINENQFQNEKIHTNVLITGSLYLVGLALEVLNFQI